ncbi:hypothetical protein SN15_05830 [Stenotrophomonas maltophilia]|nr:hypothetical protein SN15_05830 [Stenotrophomonas maltophilia]
MRGLGWGPIGMLVVAGWILNTIGEGAFKVLLYLVMGIVLLRKVVALIARLGWLKPQGSSAANDATGAKRQRSESRRGANVAELLRAVQERDADRIEFLVLQKNISPYESGRVPGQAGISNASQEAETVGYRAATEFFEDWSRNGAKARFSRT